MIAVVFLIQTLRIAVPYMFAAMGGVISMTKAIAHEYQGTGVTANCLAPGAATRLGSYRP